MLTITTVFQILTLAIGLLTSANQPGVSPELHQYAVSVANNAIVVANNYLLQAQATGAATSSDPGTTTDTATSTPPAPVIAPIIVIPPPPAPVLHPSCTLTGTLHNVDMADIQHTAKISFDWTTTDLPADAHGSLGYYGWNGSFALNESIRNNPIFSWDHYFYADFGGTRCYAYFPTANFKRIGDHWDGSDQIQYKDGDTSTSVIPDAWKDIFPHN